MEQFRSYLKEIEISIPDSDKAYFREVTKPVYECMMSEIENRFSLLMKENKSSDHYLSQSQIVTGYVDIYDFRKESDITECLEPIINVNQNVTDVVKTENNEINIQLQVKENKYLFSFLCNLNYDEFSRLSDTKHKIRVCLKSGEITEVDVIYRINTEFKQKELDVKRLFCSNRPQESYFDIPLCRRFIDVYIEQEIDIKDITDILLADIPGRICIPVWNILCDSKTSSGSRKNGITLPDKKVIMPYGLSGEQNQYSISFENCSDRMIDGLVKINDYNCNYYFSKYFKDDSVLKLYTSDKKVWGSSFQVYRVMNVDDHCLEKLNDSMVYSCLDGYNDFRCHKREITEAMIYYFTHIFYNITRLKVQRIQKNDDEICIIFGSEHSKDLNMDDENLKFLIELFNTHFIGNIFSGRVIERG